MAKLTAQARKHIAPKNFGIAPKAGAKGRFPVEDKAHARNALARIGTALNESIVSWCERHPGVGERGGCRSLNL